MCRLYAKAGTWDKFIAYESKMRAQRQIAATICYLSWGFIALISVGGFALLYFFTEFLRGLKELLLALNIVFRHLSFMEKTIFNVGRHQLHHFCATVKIIFRFLKGWVKRN